jgi:hypothetical protein
MVPKFVRTSCEAVAPNENCEGRGQGNPYDDGRVTRIGPKHDGPMQTA